MSCAGFAASYQNKRPPTVLRFQFSLADLPTSLVCHFLFHRRDRFSISTGFEPQNTDLGCDEAEKSGDGRGSHESCFDQKQRDARQLIIPPSVSVESCSDEKQQDVRQPMSPPSVSALCSTCAQPQSESDWNFSIEDGVPIKNKNNSSTSIKRADLMKDKDKAGKEQKMRRNKGRVFYRRPAHVLFSP